MIAPAQAWYCLLFGIVLCCFCERNSKFSNVRDVYKVKTWILKYSHLVWCPDFLSSQSGHPNFFNVHFFYLHLCGLAPVAPPESQPILSRINELPKHRVETHLQNTLIRLISFTPSWKSCWFTGANKQLLGSKLPWNVNANYFSQILPWWVTPQLQVVRPGKLLHQPHLSHCLSVCSLPCLTHI